MKRASALLILILINSGCVLFTRTVYVPDGKAVRLRQDVKRVKVWALDADGNPVAGRMVLSEGWYCGPDQNNQ